VHYATDNPATLATYTNKGNFWAVMGANTSTAPSPSVYDTPVTGEMQWTRDNAGDVPYKTTATSPETP
jgi:hypothetical protein